MNYDAYFTDPFLKQFPDNLLGSGLSVDSAFIDLYRALQKGNLLALADGNTMLNIIKKLKITEPELAKVLEGLETAGRIRAVNEIKDMPACFESITMPKKKRQLIGCAFAQAADTVYHDELNEADKHQAFMKAGKKPMFLNAQLRTGEIQFLYKERSATYNVGDAFKWSSALPLSKVPLTEIRILDPYFYVNISNIDLESILKPIVKFANTNVSISVISDVNAISTMLPEQVKNKVLKAFSTIDIPEINLTLYSQKGSASPFFHKRVLWTNLWAMQSDRGFDFIKISEKGNATVKSNNILNYTGRYTGKQSTWHDIFRNWEGYLKASVEMEGYD